MLTKIPERHTLLFLSRAGEEHLWLHKERIYPDSAAAWSAVRDRLRGVPVITRRRVAPGEPIPVGMSLPIRQDGGRWRMTSRVPLEGVVRAVSAVQAAERCAEGSLPFSSMIAEMLQRAPLYGFAVGLFGSAALETVTGLPYCHAGSGLDVLLLPRENADLPAIGALLRRLEGKWSLRIDAEVALGGERYGKLAEILSGTGTILVKGGINPVLCSTRTALESLGGGKLFLKSEVIDYGNQSACSWHDCRRKSQ